VKILFLLHDFLPAHAAGTELYSGALALRLAERGHEVRVFATEKDIARPHLALERREWSGLVVHELVNNLFYRDFDETWEFPPAVAALERVLDDFRPDVVHVQHLLYLSVGCVEAVHARGIPLFFTLHDFWLQCPRFGQRIHADGAICHTIDFGRCGTCLARFDFAQSATARRTARGVAALHRWTGLDLSRAARRAGSALRTRRAARAVPVAVEVERDFAARATRRDTALRARLVPCVERFFAPSRFLAERFREWGIPAAKLETLGYGLELEPFRGLVRTSSSTTRVAFIGTLAPHKAPHLVLEAWQRLPSEVRDRARLVLHGPKDHFPAYVADLERAARAAGAELPGRLDRARVPAELASIDLLIVPSVWYENSPLVIHEALAARTPVLVSDLGGMAELVEEGRQGWRFRCGDATDLAAKLEGLLREPRRLAELDFGPPPKDMRTSALELEERYAAALRAGSGR
jgi:glycosyltransferase involved in cell wall biosynthesis